VSGEVVAIWSRQVEGALPEDEYEGLQAASGGRPTGAGRRAQAGVV